MKQEQCTVNSKAHTSLIEKKDGKYEKRKLGFFYSLVVFSWNRFSIQAHHRLGKLQLFVKSFTNAFLKTGNVAFMTQSVRSK